MVVPSRLLTALMLLSMLGLAGCATTPSEEAERLQEAVQDVPDVEATSTTGGIRGVVVDERITPIKDAQIEVVGADKTATTLDDGLFAISGLEAGEYFIKVSHPLYAPAQQNVQVVAGEEEPKAVKIQLTRTVFGEPYKQTIKFDGFIVCSVNTAGVLSEECGEGVGVPDMGRVGGQGNNNVQFDVLIESADIKSLTFEKYWVATSEAGNELYTPVGTNWVCDPGCAWDNVTNSMKGPSPQHAYVGTDLIADREIGPGVTVTMFTWAGSFEDPAGVAFNQKYEDFMTLSYFLPLPPEWSFVAGSPDPF